MAIRFCFTSWQTCLRLLLGKARGDHVLERLRLFYYRIYFLLCNLIDLTNIIPTYEPEVTKIFMRLEKVSIVVDVGAYIGRYAIMALSRKAKKIIAIEPHPETYKLLVANVGKFKQVTTVNVAISDEEGTVRLLLSKPGSHSIIHNVFKYEDERCTGTSIKVPSTTLDVLLSRLAIERVDFIKIDVEGAELKVLKGAEKVLDKTKHIIIEVHYPFGSIEHLELRRFLTNKGFKVMELLDPITGEIRHVGFKLYACKLRMISISSKIGELPERKIRKCNLNAKVYVIDM